METKYKHIIKKAHSRLYCLRKLRYFNYRTELLQVFYTSTVSIVLACLGGNAVKEDKERLEKVIKKVGRI